MGMREGPSERRDPPARPRGQAIPWEGPRVLLQAERPGHHRSVTAAAQRHGGAGQLGLGLQFK